jgi:hypothetical protein
MGHYRAVVDPAVEILLTIYCMSVLAKALVRLYALNIDDSVLLSPNYPRLILERYAGVFVSRITDHHRTQSNVTIRKL